MGELRKFEAQDDRRDFSFDGATVTAIAPQDGVYDGDTFHAIFKHNGRIYQWKVRCLHYDSPEMKPPRSQADRDDEKRRAILARDALASQICGRKIQIVMGKFDMYGRILGEVFVNGYSMSNWMLAQGHGVPMNTVRPKRGESVAEV